MIENMASSSSSLGIVDISSLFENEHAIVEVYEYSNFISLANIDVHEEQRRNGIGTEIIRKIREYSAQVGKPIILIAVDPEGDTPSWLEIFYHNNGFDSNRRGSGFTNIDLVYRPLH